MNRRQLLVWVVVVLLSMVCFRPHVYAAEEIVELRLQTVKALRGFVIYPSGDIVKGAKVAELTSDWKTELRETRTDEEGRFSLAPVKGRKVYYLQINRLWGKRSLRLRLNLA